MEIRKAHLQVTSNMPQATKDAQKLDGAIDVLQSKSTRTLKTAQDAVEATRAGTFRTGGKGGARDFSEQVQGLGGLVRAYASVAANLYAMSAAFNQLSRAADTSNLIKSADFLSGRYGVALKVTATQIKEVTDNALTMKDSLAFANFGAAAGLTSRDINKLALAGKAASLALGRDLDDSMNRIFKGTIKLTPNLLDELGLLVKLSDATEEYARANNKNALSLTQVEKMQAFVNAVTDEANRKYGELGKSGANPYSKLLGSVKDLTDETLRFVNTGMSPIVDFLSFSPAALVSTLALVGGKLASLAVPDFMPNLERRAVKTAEALSTVGNSIVELNSHLKQLHYEDDLVAHVLTVDQSKLSKNAKQAANTFFDVLDDELASSGELFVPSPRLDFLTEEYKYQLNNMVKEGEKVLKSSKTDPILRQQAREQIEFAKTNIKYVKDLEALNFNIASKETEKLEILKQQQIATIQNLSAQGAYNVAQLQYRGKHLAAISAAREVERQITQEKLKQAALDNANTKWNNALIRTGGIMRTTGATVTTVVSSIIGSLGKIGLAIGALTAAWQGFQFLMKKVGWATELADDVIKALKPAEDQFKAILHSQEQLANAKSLNDIFELKAGTIKLYAELNKTLEDSEIAYGKFQQSATWWDKFWKGGKVEKVRQTTLAQSLSAVTDINTTRELIEKNFGKAMQEHTAVAAGNIKFTIDKALDKGDALKAWETFLKNIPDLASAEKQALLKDLLNIYNETVTPLEKIANNMLDLKNSSTELGKISKDYVNSLIKQTTHTKAYSELLTSFSASLNSGTEGVAMMLGNFSTELAAISNTSVDQRIITLNKQLGELGKRADELKLTGKDRTEFLNRERDAIVNQNSAYSLMVGQALAMTTQLHHLAREAVQVTVAVAQMNRNLSDLGTYESAYGKSASTVKERLRIEAEIAEIERKGVETRLSSLKKIEKDRTLDVGRLLGGELSGVESSVQMLDAARKEVSSLSVKIQELMRSGGSEKEIAAEQARLSILFGALRALEEINLAVVNTQGDVAASILKTRSEYAKTIELENQSSADRSKDQERELSTIKELRDIEKNRLDTIARGLPELQTLTTELQNQLDKEAALHDVTSKRNKLEERRETLLRQLSDLEAGRGGADRAQEFSRVNAELAENVKLLEGLDQQVSTINLDSKLKAIELAAAKASIEFSIFNGLLNQFRELNELKSANLFNTIDTRIKLEKQSIELARAEASEQIKNYNNSTKFLNERVAALMEENVLNKNSTVMLQYQAKLQENQLGVQIASAKLLQQEMEHTKALTVLRMKAQEARIWDTDGFTEYARDLEQNFRASVQSLRAEAKSVGETLNDSLISAFDSTADAIADMFKTGEFTFKSMGEVLRNELANAYSEAAAQQLKVLWKDLIPQPEMTAAEKAAEDAAFRREASDDKLIQGLGNLASAIEANTIALGGKPGTTQPLDVRASSIPQRGWNVNTAQEVNVKVDGAATTGVSAADKAVSETNKEAADTFMNSSVLVSTALLTFTGQWKQAAFMFLQQLAVTMLNNQGSSGIFSSVASLFSTSANGNVVNSRGPVKLSTHADGGIVKARDPHIAVFGEGRKSEAYVPLPDNRSIPVTLSGGGSGSVSFGSTNISISVQSDGNVSTEMSGELGKLLGSAVKRTVQEEMLKQVRPGGALYGRGR